MTLIALRTDRECAEILTDTLCYSVGEASFLNRSDKVHAFPALRMLVAGKGPAELLDEWVYGIGRYGFQVCADIDGFDELAVQLLPLAWENIENDPGTREYGLIYQAGWSPTQQRYVAYQYDSRRGFESRDVSTSGVFCDPPVLSRLSACPRSREDWVDIAEAAYSEHSFAVGKKTMIGGDLLLSRLTDEGVTQQRIHTIPDDDWRFRQMMIGTLHRYGQLGPCPCGSGQPYVVCHLTASFDKTWPCPCTSGKPFYDCHRVEVTDPESMQHWVDHADDFERTRVPLRAAWREAFPDEPEPTPPVFIGRHKRTSGSPAAAPAPIESPAEVLLSRRDRRAAARRAARTPR